MNKYSRELKMILLLTDNHLYNTQQLADALGTTQRNIYYEFEHLQACGFKLIKEGTKYRLDRSHPFFKKLCGAIALSQEDAMFIYQLLDTANSKNFHVKDIKVKLERYYNLEPLTSPAVIKQQRKNLIDIKEAIKNQKIALIKDYSSPHSHTISDRLVEPFELMNNETEVRCYEIKSGQNKTFKISRMKAVSLQEVEWLHESEHKKMFIDIFRFSGEEKQRVVLKLGQLSYRLLLEEYPLSELYLTAKNHKTWLLETEVTSFLGIGRFVLGLYNDIEIIENNNFKDYIKNEINKMAQLKT